MSKYETHFRRRKRKRRRRKKVIILLKYAIFKLKNKNKSRIGERAGTCVPKQKTQKNERKQHRAIFGSLFRRFYNYARTNTHYLAKEQK